MIFHISYGWLTGTHNIYHPNCFTAHMPPGYIIQGPFLHTPIPNKCHGTGHACAHEDRPDNTQKYGKALQPSCHDMDWTLPKSLQWIPCLWSVGISRKIIQFVHSLPAVHASLTYKTLRSIGVPMEVPFQALAVAWPGISKHLPMPNAHSFSITWKGSAIKTWPKQKTSKFSRLGNSWIFLSHKICWSLETCGESLRSSQAPPFARWHGTQPWH